ncbi:hypothetical protein FHG87_019507 [Trinorchestia longiramus]|nr:hypothetical protein FHG87_019507 [Trinorchestia longiramus]
MNLINTNSLQQHAIEPTRQNNILELVITTLDLRIVRLEVTDKIGDHHMIDFAIQVHVPNDRAQLRHSLTYNRANFELMNEKLSSFDYEVLMRNKNAEECYMILKEEIKTDTEHYIPTKQIRPTNNPPWFSQEIKLLINARKQSYKRLKRYQTEPYRQKHVRSCKGVKRTMRDTERNKETAVAAQAKTNLKSYEDVNNR